MHYTYVLLSEADRRFYMGTTSDLRKRVGPARHWPCAFYECRSNFSRVHDGA